MTLNCIRQSYICCHHYVTKAQFSTIEVLVAMPMTRWEFRIVPCLAGENAFATCLKMRVIRCAMTCTSEFASAFWGAIQISCYFYHYRLRTRDVSSSSSRQPCKFSSFQNGRLFILSHWFFNYTLLIVDTSWTVMGLALIRIVEFSGQLTVIVNIIVYNQISFFLSNPFWLFWFSAN